jgi:hypothetical protein
MASPTRQAVCGINQVVNASTLATSLLSKAPKLECKDCPEGTVARFPSLACIVSG